MNRPPLPSIELEGRRFLCHGMDPVWRELNNPEALRYCIRQCQSIQQISARHFRASLRAGIGPLAVPVSARLEVVPESPPQRFALTCSMSLGMLGNSVGRARVTLDEEMGGVSLVYRIEVGFSGRIARYGAVFLDQAVDRNMGRFFERFDEWMRDSGDSST